MACVVLLELSAKDEAIDGMKETFKNILGDTRAFDGCQGVEVTQDQDNPNTMVLVEKWDTRQHYEKYLAWREERGDLEAMGAALQGPPSIRYMDIVDA